MKRQCRICGDVLEEKHFHQKETQCKFCDWKKRHTEEIENLPRETADDILGLYKLIFYNINDSLNTICQKNSIVLEWAIKIIGSKCVTLGNKRIRIMVKCDNCGKDKETHICKLKTNSFNFCSHKCYSEFRKKYYVGSKASVYKKVKVQCDNCDKSILKNPYKIEKELNRFGESHNFCDHNCYSSFRSKYYRGNKNWSTGRKKSIAMRSSMREATLKRYSENGFGRKPTKPQVITNNLLDELGIKYENEYTSKYYSMDNYLTDNNLMIEVMGDYFHTNPLKYPQNSKKNSIQRKGIARDKRKYTYIKKYYHIEILYLWEDNLKNNPELCKRLIEHYVENKGLIENYQSFNYELKNNKLLLKEKIVKPYFIN